MMRSAAASGLVRVTVTSETRRVDLALPAAVPVAELLPELARCVGRLQARAVHRGYRLVTRDGRILAGDTGLQEQGVVDGSVVAVVAAADDEDPRRYDDVAEAMADAVESEFAPWSEDARRRAAEVAALVMLLAGAGFVCTQRGSTLAVSAAVTLASILVVGSAVASRASRTPAAPAVALVGCVYAAASGGSAAAGSGSVGALLVCAGAGASTAGALGCVGLARGRTLLLPAVMAGIVLMVTGLVIRTTSVAPAFGITAVVAVVAMAGSVFPRWALHVAGGPSNADAGSHGPVSAVDLDRVRADARLGHEILAAMFASVGAVLALAAPWAVSLGGGGTLVAVLDSVVVMLRTRQYRVGTEVLAGLCSGGLGLVSTAVSVLCLHPDWRPFAAVVLPVGGVLLLMLTPLAGAASSRRDQVLEALENAAILALPATLALASGRLPVLWP